MSQMNLPLKPQLGFGLGLRPEHYEAVLALGAQGASPGVDWFEVLTENYMVPGGKPLHYLDRVQERFTVAMHGVSLSIGSTDQIDLRYLDELKKLVRRVQPAWISDHLCWTGIEGRNLHDLMPLPHTSEAVEHVATRVRIVQDILEQRILLENVSSYVAFAHSEMSEADFVAAVAETADCLLLVDINNIYVSAHNHGFDPYRYLERLPPARVWQLHLAGHTRSGSMLIDTHDQPVAEGVWGLYREALRRFGPVTTMIERDDNIPPLPELVNELSRAREIAAALFRSAA